MYLRIFLVPIIRQLTTIAMVLPRFTVRRNKYLAARVLYRGTFSVVLSRDDGQLFTAVMRPRAISRGKNSALFRKARRMEKSPATKPIYTRGRETLLSLWSFLSSSNRQQPSKRFRAESKASVAATACRHLQGMKDTRKQEVMDEVGARLALVEHYPLNRTCPIATPGKISRRVKEGVKILNPRATSSFGFPTNYGVECNLKPHLRLPRVAPNRSDADPTPDTLPEAPS